MEAISLRVESKEVQALFKLAPERVQSTLFTLISLASIETQRIMRINAPAGVGGGSGLRGSIKVFLDRTHLSGTVEPQAPYAVPVEKGSRPHWASVKDESPLAKWADLKGINRFALQRSIAARGTKPHPFIGPTENQATPVIQSILERGVSKLTEELNNGR